MPEVSVLMSYSVTLCTINMCKTEHKLNLVQTFPFYNHLLNCFDFKAVNFQGFSLVVIFTFVGFTLEL